MNDHCSSIEGLGWFWPLDSDDDHAVVGHLTASIDGGVHLELAEPMLTARSWWSTGDELDQTVSAVLGFVGNVPVTLLNGQVVSSSSSSATRLATREGLRFTRAFAGAHLPVVGRRDGSTSVIADALAVEFDLVEEWVGRRGLQITEETKADRTWTHASTVRFEYPETLVAPVPGGCLELQGEWTRPRFDAEVVGFRSSSLLRICFDSPTDVEDAFAQASSIQLLLSLIAADAPSARGFRLHHPDQSAGHRDGTPLYKRVSVIAPWARRHPEGPTATAKLPLGSGRMALLTFEELGGIDGLARWVKLADGIHLILSLLSSAAFVRKLPRENEFLNTCSALEGLHRHLNPTTLEAEEAAKAERDRLVGMVPTPDRPTLRRALRHIHEPTMTARLREVAELAPLTASAVTGGDVRRWSEVVTWTRNQVVHPNAPEDVERRIDKGLRPANGAEYLALSHSIYWITTAALMRAIGASDDLMASRIRDYELTWRNQMVRDTVARWTRDDQTGDAGFIESGDAGSAGR